MEFHSERDVLLTSLKKIQGIQCIILLMLQRASEVQIVLDYDF